MSYQIIFQNNLNKTDSSKLSMIDQARARLDKQNTFPMIGWLKENLHKSGDEEVFHQIFMDYLSQTKTSKLESLKKFLDDWSINKINDQDIYDLALQEL